MTRAAARLHIAQPALSQAIAALESQIGFALFERVPRGVGATPHGATCSWTRPARCSTPRKRSAISPRRWPARLTTVWRSGSSARRRRCTASGCSMTSPSAARRRKSPTATCPIPREGLLEWLADVERPSPRRRRSSAACGSSPCAASSGSRSFRPATRSHGSNAHERPAGRRDVHRDRRGRRRVGPRTDAFARRARAAAAARPRSRRAPRATSPRWSRRRFAGSRLSVPAFLRTSLDRMLDGTPFTVQGLPGMMTADGKVNFVRPFLTDGLLTIVSI